jgi:hypothetical protein
VIRTVRISGSTGSWKGFFANAGWFGVPPYDESGRERWTRELLLSRREDPASIAQVIRRLADPREYPNDPDSAVAVAEQLYAANAVIQRGVIGLDAIRPILFNKLRVSRNNQLHGWGSGSRRCFYVAGVPGRERAFVPRQA